MAQVVRAFPLLPGKERELQEFAAALRGPRAAEAREFYAHYGASSESWHLQETPHGTWVIAVTIVDERPLEETFGEYAGSERPFDRWFKDHVKRLTGIDPDQQPLGPPTECVFDTAQVPGPDQQAP